MSSCLVLVAVFVSGGGGDGGCGGGAVDVGVSPGGTLDKETFKKAFNSRRLVLLCWRRCWWSHLSCSLLFEDNVNGTIDLIELVLKFAIHSSCTGTSSCWTMTMIFI